MCTIIITHPDPRVPINNRIPKLPRIGPPRWITGMPVAMVLSNFPLLLRQRQVVVVLDRRPYPCRPLRKRSFDCRPWSNCSWPDKMVGTQHGDKKVREVETALSFLSAKGIHFLVSHAHTVSLVAFLPGRFLFLLCCLFFFLLFFFSFPNHILPFVRMEHSFWNNRFHWLLGLDTL